MDARFQVLDAVPGPALCGTRVGRKKRRHAAQQVTAAKPGELRELLLKAARTGRAAVTTG